MMLNDKRFLGIYWTQIFGVLADNFFKTSLVIMITTRQISIGNISFEQLVPLSGGLFVLPFCLFSALAGQVANSMEKVQLVRIIKILELFIIVLISLAFYLDSPFYLFVLLFFMGVQSTFISPLKLSILSELLDKDELLLGNSLLYAGSYIAILLGTVLGGWVSPSFTIVILCLFSIMGVFFSYCIKNFDSSYVKNEINYNFVGSTYTLVKEVFQEKKLIVSILGVSSFWFTGASVLNLIPLYTKIVLGGGEFIIILFLCIFTLGIGIGSTLINIFSKKSLEMGFVPLSCFFMSLFVGDLYFITFHAGEVQSIDINSFFDYNNSFRIIFDLLCMAICGGIFIVPQVTFLQHLSSSEKLAGNVAASNTIDAILVVIAALFIMLLQYFDVKIPMIFLILGSINLLVSFVLYYYFYSEQTIRLIGQIIICFFYDLTVKGRKNLPKEGPYMIISNHITFIDWLFIWAAHPLPVRFVMEQEYYNSFLGHFFFKQAMIVPIASGIKNKKVLEKAYDLISEGIEDKAVYCIFPEGALTKDGEMQNLQSGILKILRRNKIKVVSFTIDGLWGSFFSYKGGAFRKCPKLFRRKVEISIHRPQELEEITLTSLKEMLDAPRNLDRSLKKI